MNAYEKAREDARQRSGQFGEQVHSAPDLELTPHYGDANIDMGGRSPWGTVQWVTKDAPGITFVGTASHGGYRLSPERNALIPKPLRKSDRWYEEDCEARVVDFYFADELHGKSDLDEFKVQNDERIQTWFPLEWEKVNGEVIDPKTNRIKAEHLWMHEHQDEPLMRVAAAVEGGFIVKTVTVNDNTERQYFVTNEQYEQADETYRNTWGAKAPLLPEGAEPREVAQIEGYTAIADGKTPAGQARINKDLATRVRWNDGIRTIGEMIERGAFTAKSVYIENGSRKYALVNGNTNETIRVSKQTFEAFGAPDRDAKQIALEDYMIARDKKDKLRERMDTSWRPAQWQHEQLRALVKDEREKFAAYQAM